MSCNCVPNKLYSLRSDTSVLPTDQLINEFKKSIDYENYQKNFKDPLQLDRAKLLTYNFTKKQALFIPIVQSGKEVSAFISFFDLGKQNFFSNVLISLGDLDNFIDLPGNINIYLPTKEVLFTGEFKDSSFFNITPPVMAAPGGGYAGCIHRSIVEIQNNDQGTIFCILFPEECVAGILLHCAIEYATSAQ